MVTLDFSHDFGLGSHTLLLVCTSLDPALNPAPPTGPLIQFIYTKNQLVDRPPGQDHEYRSPGQEHEYRPPRKEY